MYEKRMYEKEIYGKEKEIHGKGGTKRGREEKGVCGKNHGGFFLQFE